MKAVVVYESIWGNTAKVAQAIAAGIGPEARVMSTAEATPEAVAGADLVVAGAPLQAFSLPSDRSRQGIDPHRTHTPPNLSAPTMRHWLETLPAGHGRGAAFETKFRFSPGSAVGTISKELDRHGYAEVTKPVKFHIKGTEGPLAEGELERATEWGKELARSIR